MIVAIIQARMSSTRLPGKVLKPLAGKPMLGFMLERLKRCQYIDKLVVATSIDNSDDAIAEFCQLHNIACVRGDLDNVLARFALAAKLYPADHYLRLTADCPLIDPNLVDALIQLHLAGNYDYSCNCVPPSLPDGMDAEILRAEVLTQLTQLAFTEQHFEHVTYYLHDAKVQHPFHIGRYQHPVDLSALRLTVDYPADWQLVQQIVSASNQPQTLDLAAIQALLAAHPQWLANQHYQRNEALVEAEDGTSL